MPELSHLATMIMGQNVNVLHTTLGPIAEEKAGLILPHEHIFSNFDSLDHAAADAVPLSAVLALMGPEIARARAAGVGVLVDATSIGGARRAPLLAEISQATGLPVVVATGIFREPWITDWVRERGEASLTAWMTGELTDGIDSSGVRAGWIKLRSGDDGLTPEQGSLLRAAARASVATGAAIGSHTVRGRVARDQLDVLEGAGCPPQRFIYIHAQVEPDFSWNLALAQRGAWIEYDGIGDSPADELYLDRIRRLWDAGFGAQILLSQDRGWYDPCKPGGGAPKPYTYLTDLFLPKLRAAGFDEAAIRTMTHENPFRAYAR